MWLIFIRPIFHWFCRITQFSPPKMQRTIYPLLQVRQFMQKSLYIHFPAHISLEFNHKVTGAIVMTQNITITNNLFTFQSTMNNIHINFVTGEEVIQKPRGNILTDDLRITVSRMVDAKHVLQCRNQMNDDTNRSFSLAVMLVSHSIHLSEPLC